MFLVSMFNDIDRTIVSILQVPIKRYLALSDAPLGAHAGLSFAVVYSSVGQCGAQGGDRGDPIVWRRADTPDEPNPFMTIAQETP